MRKICTTARQKRRIHLVILGLFLLVGQHSVAAAAQEQQESPMADKLTAHAEHIRQSTQLRPGFRSRLLKLLPRIAQGEPVDIILPGSKGNTALHYACAIGDVELVKTLLQLGADTRLRTHKGASPRDCADGPHRRQILELLGEPVAAVPQVKKPVKPAHKAPEPQPLPVPAEPEAAQEPPPAPASPQAAPAAEPTPEAPSAMEQNTDATGPDISRIIAQLRNIPASDSSNYRHKKKLLQLLTRIQAGEDINYAAPGTGGYTALHHTCAMGDFFLSIWLLEHGANPHVRTSSGATPEDCLAGPNASFIRAHLVEYSTHRAQQHPTEK